MKRSKRSRSRRSFLPRALVGRAFPREEEFSRLSVVQTGDETLGADHLAGDLGLEYDA
jgi:hypothetical protein